MKPFMSTQTPARTLNRFQAKTNFTTYIWVFANIYFRIIYSSNG